MIAHKTAAQQRKESGGEHKVKHRLPSAAAAASASAACAAAAS